MKAANRIATNTVVQYGRMLVTIGISLYTTRLVLDGLGAVDFGIFSVVAGVAFILSFLNTAMATSTQRFLSFYEGHSDSNKQREVFTSSFFLHLSLALIVVLALELARSFLFDHFLNIPSGRLQASSAVYHYIVISIFFTIVSVPFTASLIAHENMIWVSVVNITEAVLKLSVAVLLHHVTYDRLVFFGIGTATISALIMVVYAVFCFSRYPECNLLRAKLMEGFSFFRTLASNASWNLFGVLAGMSKNQGMIVLLNYYHGTVANASFAVANQVSGQLNVFSGTMLRAVNPQIMKSEGNGNRDRMIRLSLLTCKYCFSLLAIIAIPAIFEIDTILSLWLKDVPQYTAKFCVWVLIGYMMNQLTIGLDSAAQATGKIKFFMVTVGMSKIVMIPLGILLSMHGFSLMIILYTYAFCEFLGSVIRVLNLRKLVSLSIKNFLKEVPLPLFLPLLFSCIAALSVGSLPPSMLRLLITLITCTLAFLLSFYLIGMQTHEKVFFQNLMNQAKVLFTNNLLGNGGK